MATIPVMMLGNDMHYQYAFAPSVGADSLTSAGSSPAQEPVFWLPKPYDFSAVPSGYKLRQPKFYNSKGELAFDAVPPGTPGSSNNIADLAKELNVDGNTIINASRDSLIALINRNKPGLSAEEVANMLKAAGKGEGQGLEGNMPWIILGGAALVAVMFMAGTRKK